MSEEKTRRRSDRSQTVQENRILRRENARLRKQIQKLNGAVNSMTYKGFDEEEPKNETKTHAANPCPKCGKETGEVDLGRGIYRFCSCCSYRERKPG